MENDKRQSPRVALICKVSTVFGERVLVFNCHTENVGMGGLKVILDEKLHITTMVEVEIFLPDREESLKCKGQIVWVNEVLPCGVEPRFFETGIQFLEMRDPDKKLLHHAINILLAQEKKQDGQGS